MQNLMILGLLNILSAWGSRLNIFPEYVHAIMFSIIIFNMIAALTPKGYSSIKTVLFSRGKKDYLIRIIFYPIYLSHKYKDLKSEFQVAIFLSLGIFFLYFHSFMLYYYNNNLSLIYFFWSGFLGFSSEDYIKGDNPIALLLPVTFLSKQIKGIFNNVKDFVYEEFL